MTDEQKHILYNMGMDRHHLTPASRNGKTTKRNIVWIYRKKHLSWHYLFLHLTLEEVILFIRKNGLYIKRKNQNDWKIIFKKMTVEEAINFLERLARIKRSQSYQKS